MKSPPYLQAKKLINSIQLNLTSSSFIWESISNLEVLFKTSNVGVKSTHLIYFLFSSSTTQLSQFAFALTESVFMLYDNWNIIIETRKIGKIKNSFP